MQTLTCRTYLEILINHEGKKILCIIMMSFPAFTIWRSATSWARLMDLMRNSVILYYNLYCSRKKFLHHDSLLTVKGLLLRNDKASLFCSNVTACNLWVSLKTWQRLVL
ncbi:hypothetical protein QQP08_008230 [Theobroma cacao]|nr:hypothetical protein QQP08_008230 [Theobroma cacao]